MVLAIAKLGVCVLLRRGLEHARNSDGDDGGVIVEKSNGCPCLAYAKILFLKGPIPARYPQAVSIFIDWGYVQLALSMRWAMPFQARLTTAFLIEHGFIATSQCWFFVGQLLSHFGILGFQTGR